MPEGRRSIAAWASLMVLLGSPSAPAQPTDESRVAEQSVKAAFLYKFASYVYWPDDEPADPGEPWSIGVIGAPGLAAELAEITADRRIGDRPILVQRLRASDPVDGLHILFVGREEANRLDGLLGPARTRPILTVTDSDNALASGSIINFIVLDERVRFEISLTEAEQSGLRLDSRLLAVAEDVRRTAE